MAGERVLVAGGAGFLGSHLCERLLRRGHQVVCLDNLQTGRRRNIQALLGGPHFTFIEHDITQPLPSAVGEGYAFVCNLACAASPPSYQKDPVHTLLTCVVGAQHLLQLTRTCSATFLQASTSEVYGDPLVHPQPEDYRGSVNCTGPRACYDEGKRAAEALCCDYERMHGTRVRLARIFNTYGPRMAAADGRVVSTFIAQALRNQSLPVYGNGQQTRSFCYVDDLIDGLTALLHSTLMGPVNLGNPIETTVADLAGLVLELTASTAAIEHRPLPIDDPRQRQPMIDRARRELGWEPRVGLRQGIEKTVAAMRNAL